MDENQDSNTTTPSVPPRKEDLSGKQLGDYQLTRSLGQGGMGQVYLARQLSLKRDVAVKILKSELASNETTLRRFQAEAEAVARITHANIVQVYSIGQAEGLHYMALEYVDGRNLRDYLARKGPPDLPVALNIMRQVAAALQRASELGFVHRDIKPENILISRQGEVKVADFGLSRCLTGNAQPLNLTQSGVTMGTPLYMSPEQVRGQTVDPRSDIYSFGVTCYHMLRGEPPFRGQTAFEVALQHVQNEPMPLQEARPDLPPEVCQLVHKMMAKKPEDRHQSAREILRDIIRIREIIASGASNPTILQSESQIPARADSALLLTVASSSNPTIPPMAPKRSWGQKIIGGSVLALALAIGVAIHWWQNPPPQIAAVENPTFVENGTKMVAEREKEMLRKINDKEIKLDFAADELLELSLLYIKEKRFDDAMKLFDLKTLSERGPFKLSIKDARLRDHNLILCDFGKAIVLAYQDEALKSTQLFQSVLDRYPPILPKAGILAKGKPALWGPIEQFFYRGPDNSHGAIWKKTVADAVERDAKNLSGKFPESLNRLRSYAPKAPNGLPPKL